MQQRDFEQFKHLQMRKTVYDMVLSETKSIPEAQKFSSLCFNVFFLKNVYSDVLMTKIRQYIRRVTDQAQSGSRGQGY